MQGLEGSRAWTRRSVGILLVVTVLAGGGRVRAQTPHGTISGRVSDGLLASVSGATVSIVSDDTGVERTVVTAADGLFTAAALPPASYRISVTAPGFRRAERRVDVEAGATLTVDVRLELADVTEQVIVTEAQSLVRRSHHQVGAVVTRDQIERLPLNGRTVLELARLEPGMIPTRLADGRMFVSSLGGGLHTFPRVGATRVTVDGANITTPGTAGVLLQVSPDAVREFQTTTASFDAATSATTNGAISIVTRSGTNEHRGSGFYLFRNSRLSAYPALSRDPADPDPFFERHQVGVWSGGPLHKGRAFYFGHVERTDQLGVVTIELLDEFAPLGGAFPSPYTGNQFNARLDVRGQSRHNAFVRYTGDRNATFGPLGPALLPSSWSERPNNAQQTIVGVTSVLSDRAVHEFRVSYLTSHSRITAATARNCGGCFGLGEMRTVVFGSNLIYGGSGDSSRTAGWRFHLTQSLTWQKSSHTIRIGGEWDHDAATFSTSSLQADELTLFSPRLARERVPELPLPAAFSTPDDMLHLPARDLAITVGSGITLWEEFRPERRRNLYRLYLSDTWRAHARLSVNAGLGWSYEPNARSRDLPLPVLLTGILGERGLEPPKPRIDTFSPAAGFVWTATASGNTLVRGGIGRYVDPAGSLNTLNQIRERHLLLPLGTGTLRQTGANMLHEGRPLSFPAPTSFTGRDLLNLVPVLRLELERLLNPNNRSLTVRNLDRLKEGRNLQDPASTTPHAVHATLGVQRELAHGVVIGADVAWKRFVQTFINGIDYNRWNSRGGPVLPRCTLSQIADVSARCSNGPLYFDTTIGHARYLGLLVRAEKRFAAGTQFLVSYALGSFVGSNGGVPAATSEFSGGRMSGFNNDDWSENYGPLPTDFRHILSVSAALELPLGLHAAFSTSAYSAPPFAPYVGAIDFNGDGTINDLLPGTRINQFGRGLARTDLVRLVDGYNRTLAGTSSWDGRTLPSLSLPQDFSFYDSFFTQDVRITRAFDLGVLRSRASVFVEVFNLFNTANLVNFGSDLRNPAAFGRPSARSAQVFGSGGPRAVQLGAQVRF